MFIKKIQNAELYRFLDEFKNENEFPITNVKYPYFAILGNTFLVAPTVIGLLIIFIISSPLLVILSLIKELILERLIRKEKELEQLRKLELLKKEKLKILNNLEDSFIKYGQYVHGTIPEYLCLDKYNHDIKLELYQFILIFLNQLNYNHFTKYKYRVQYRNDSQCETGRRRSLKDIYLICKNYYPTCRIYEVFNILIILFKKDQIKIQYCSTINDYTFYPTRVSEYANLEKFVNYFKNQTKIKITMQEIINHLNFSRYEKDSLS